MLGGNRRLTGLIMPRRLPPVAGLHGRFVGGVVSDFEFMSCLLIVLYTTSCLWAGMVQLGRSIRICFSSGVLSEGAVSVIVGRYLKIGGAFRPLALRWLRS